MRDYSNPNLDLRPLAALLDGSELPRSLGRSVDLSSMEHHLGEADPRAAQVSIGQRATGLSAAREHDLTHHNILLPLTPSGLPVEGVLSNSNFAASTYATYPGNVYIVRKDLRDPEHNHANLQVLRIQYEPSGRITHVTQNVNDSLLRCFFEELPPSPFVTELRNALGVGAPESRDQLQFRRLVTESQESVALDEEISNRTQKDTASTLYENTFPPEAVLSVSQGEYGVVTSDKTRQIAGTHGAGPCVLVGISAIDKIGSRRVVGITHIDGMTDEIGTLRTLLEDVRREFSEESIEGYLLTMKGGDQSSQEQVRAIYRQLRLLEQSDPDCRGLVLIDVKSSGNSSLAIDIEQGQTHRFVPDPTRSHADSSVGFANFGTKRIARRVY